MEALVKMEGMRKSFYGVEVLHGVDFDVSAGEVVALCGENGAGKSTLMKILAAVYVRDEGKIQIQGKEIPNVTPLQMQREGVAMIHQELNLFGDMTVAQNIFLTREPKNKLGLVDYPKMNREAKEILQGLGQDIEPTAMVRDLKVAQKQMLEIAKAVSFDVKAIIMDEPTAVLTNVESEILFDLIAKLTAQGIGIVYVSHRLSEIIRIADRVVVLRDGSLVATEPISNVDENRIASLMVGRDIEHTVPEPFDGDKDDLVLEAKHVSGDILKDVSFSVAKGEVIGFSGLVGAGRTELMEMIFGLRKFDGGEVLLHRKPVTIKSARAAIKAGMGFATEERKTTGVIYGRSIAENMDYAYREKFKGNTILRPNAIRSRSKALIDQMRVVCRGPDQEIQNLSGGNQQKVVIAKWLSSMPDILIMDEPTRGIDVGARQEIYNVIKALAKEGKTIIVVSSDMTEVLSICQRIIVMHEGVITGVLTGDDRTENNIMQYAANVMQKEN